ETEGWRSSGLLPGVAFAGVLLILCCWSNSWLAVASATVAYRWQVAELDTDALLRQVNEALVELFVALHDGVDQLLGQRRQRVARATDDAVAGEALLHLAQVHDLQQDQAALADKGIEVGRA